MGDFQPQILHVVFLERKNFDRLKFRKAFPPYHNATVYVSYPLCIVSLRCAEFRQPLLLLLLLLLMMMMIRMRM